MNMNEGPIVPPGGSLTPRLSPPAAASPLTGAGRMGFATSPHEQLRTGAPANFGDRGPESGMRPIQYIQLQPRPSGNDFTGFPQDAYRFNAPHPVILQAQARMQASSDPSLTNFYYAVPFWREVLSDPNGNTGIGIGGQYAAVRSRSAGMMYLPAGEWYLYYPEDNLLSLAVFDARDPLFASWMLSEYYGQHALSRHASDYTLNDATPNLTILEANRWRSMVIVQNTTLPAAGVNNNLRLFTTTAPTPTRGIQLAAGASIQFVAESLVLQQIQVIREAPAPGPTLSVHVSEWV